MATVTIVQARYLRNRWGHTHPTRGGAETPGIKETASQTYGQMAPVYYDSSGTIAVATASSNIVGLLAGFALAAATGTTGNTVVYRPVLPGDVYVVATKGTSTVVTAQTQMGDLTNFDIYTGNLLVANPDSTDDTKLAAITTGLYLPNSSVSGFGFNESTDVVGDTQGRIVVEFLDNKALQR